MSANLKRPCVRCGVPTHVSPCPVCAAVGQRERASRRTQTKAQRGYGRTWELLSLRARKIQRYCSDCGVTDDLTADHSPEAWRRHAAGKVIRLVDIDVVCRRCNIARGPARPGGPLTQRDRRAAAGRPAVGHTPRSAERPPAAAEMTP